jgi:hypothetical protein
LLQAYFCVIHHDEIFPDTQHLPTFNSYAIECHLHRIPHLSERFLAFNDDTFATRPIPVTSQFRDSVPVMYGAPWLNIYTPPMCLPSRAYDCAVARARNLGAPGLFFLAFHPLHQFKAYSRSFYAQVCTDPATASELHVTSATRIRSPTDTDPGALVVNAGLQVGAIVIEDPALFQSRVVALGLGAGQKLWTGDEMAVCINSNFDGCNSDAYIQFARDFDLTPFEI